MIGQTKPVNIKSDTLLADIGTKLIAPTKQLDVEDQSFTPEPVVEVQSEPVKPTRRKITETGD